MKIDEDVECEKEVRRVIEDLRHNFALPTIKRAIKKLYMGDEE